MFRLAPIAVLLLVASSASAETIWLRGRGSDVWIEKGGQISDPQPNRKGFTRVATSPMPGVVAGERPRPQLAVQRHSDGVVFGPAYRYPHDRYYFYDPSYGYGRSDVYSPRVRYRSHYGHYYRNRHGYGHGRRYSSDREYSRDRHVRRGDGRYRGR